MAILLIISANQVREPFQFMGDIVGIYEDNHPFTQTELDRFDFLTIQGTKQNVRERLNELDIKYATAFYNTNISTWQFTDPLIEGAPIKQVWSTGQNPIKWYNVVNPFKFKWSIGQLSDSEKQLLASIDINNPSVDSAAKKIMKDLLQFNPANGVEETDLRNKIP